MRRGERRGAHDAGQGGRARRGARPNGGRVGGGGGRRWGSWVAPLFSLRRGAAGGLSTKRLDAESDTELTGKKRRCQTKGRNVKRLNAEGGKEAQSTRRKELWNKEESAT